MRVSRYASAVLLGILCVAFVVFVGLTAPELPNRPATHFNASGNPDGWMTKTAYVPFISIMGLVLPLFVVGIVYATRFLPDWTINLPHKEYWLSPNQRAATHQFLLNHTLWMSCLVVLLLGGMHFLTIQANESTPVHLPGTSVAVLMGAFLGGMAVWVIVLFRRFRKAPEAT